MKLLAMILCFLVVSPVVMAKGDSSSRLIYEYLASKGQEMWRDENGGLIRMASFSCNSTYLKDIKVQLNHCWYSVEKNLCQSDKIIPEDDFAVAKGLYDAMKKMGLPILSQNNSEENWGQIDADGLNCMMTVEHATDPESKSYICWAMKRLKN